MTPKTKAVLCTVVRVVGISALIITSCTAIIWFIKLMYEKYGGWGYLGAMLTIAFVLIMFSVVPHIYQSCKEKHEVDD